MNGRVLHIPGGDCVFHAFGHCVYEEDLNPGLHLEWRCAVFLRLEKQYDLLVEQADNFRLDEGMAGRIWEERMGRLLEVEPRCPDYAPGSGRGVPDCAHAMGSQCVLSMPACPGRCRRFSAKPKKNEID